MSIAKGTWVEIENTILAPSERAPQCPEDTKLTPYKVRVAGFLNRDANLGDTVSISSLIGRTHQGTLIHVNPSYNHSFGETVPEIITIGTIHEKE